MMRNLEIIETEAPLRSFSEEEIKSEHQKAIDEFTKTLGGAPFIVEFIAQGNRNRNETETFFVRHAVTF